MMVAVPAAPRQTWAGDPCPDTCDVCCADRWVGGANEGAGATGVEDEIVGEPVAG